MDYTEELRTLLRPLGLYDVEGGISGAVLGAVGEQLTSVWSGLETAEREALLATAESAGLDAWEALLPFQPSWLTTSGRRGAVAALLRIDGASFTVSALNATLAGCGIPAAVEETETPMTVRVSFPGTRGEPEAMERLQWRIEQILPCHLAVEYVFSYLTWAEIEQLFSTWSALEAACDDWRALEAAGGEEP